MSLLAINFGDPATVIVHRVQWTEIADKREHYLKYQIFEPTGDKIADNNRKYI